jgi:hypothetical protein
MAALTSAAGQPSRSIRPSSPPKAATGYYHDFLSPLAFPETQLLADLREYIKPTASNFLRQDINVDAVAALITRHMNGEFDATKEESDAWAESEDGQAAFNELTDSLRK